MLVTANAKINLTLDITGKRSDGYHILDSVFQSIGLFDELEIFREMLPLVFAERVGAVENGALSLAFAVHELVGLVGDLGDDLAAALFRRGHAEQVADGRSQVGDRVTAAVLFA